MGCYVRSAIRLTEFQSCCQKLLPSTCLTPPPPVASPSAWPQDLMRHRIVHTLLQQGRTGVSPPPTPATPLTTNTKGYSLRVVGHSLGAGPCQLTRLPGPSPSSPSHVVLLYLPFHLSSVPSAHTALPFFTAASPAAAQLASLMLRRDFPDLR